MIDWLIDWLIAWLVFNVQRAIFQLIQDENI